MTLQSSGILYMNQINGEFGRGNDLCIYDNCNTRKDNFSNLGDTYTSNGLKFETFDAKSYLAGSCLFKVKEFEVFRITFT